MAMADRFSTLNSRNPFRLKANGSPLPSPDLPKYNNGVEPQPLSRAMTNPNVNPLPAGKNTNPFLDTTEVTEEPRPVNNTDLSVDIFKDLSLLDQPAAPAALPAPAPAPPGLRPRGPAVHRPTGSDERRDRRPIPGSPRKAPPPRRPRGMSESSVMDSTERERLRPDRDRRERDGVRPPRTESEERRRRERRREREERYRREKERSKVAGGKPADAGKKSSRGQRGLDIIDKLDVTGIYGQGLFHHDGPFDACNPHRNKSHHRNAPMQAFDKNSANMQLGGMGPLNSRLNLDQIHGRGEEGFEAFSSTRRQTEMEFFSPTQRTEPVHGIESDGLGTSTFLEGAPASRRDLQRQESEDQTTMALNGGGLQRKKSLAQRLRGASQSRYRARAGSGAGEMRSPEDRYTGVTLDDSPPNRIPISAGGANKANTGYTRENEINPFDHDYENAYDKKGAQIRNAEQSYPPNVGRSRASSSPKGHSLVRSVTADSVGALRGSRNSEEQDGPGSRSGSAGGGFLNRMRSLKGGRRPRPERRDS